MNWALRRVAVLSIGIVLLLMANITWIMGFRSDGLREDPRNTRRYGDQYRIDRGSILAGDVELAWSQKQGKEYARRYREGEIFSPVTGHFAAYSSTGLELAENSMLDGTDPSLTFTDLLDKVTGDRTPGADVHTTIDADAQRVAYRELAASTRRRAAAVAIEVKTGAIKVMASYPSYDPNDVATRDAAKAEAALKRLDAAVGKPMLNKAANELFPPGSAFKIVTAAAALADGIAEDGTVPAGPSYRLPGTNTVIHNSHDSGSCSMPRTTLLEAFAQSCNTTFARLGAEDVGNAGMRAQSAAFGYGTRFELAPGLFAVASGFPDTDAAQTALASYGQGANTATVLQMALVAAGPLNGGIVMKPYLVSKVTSKKSTVRSADRTEFGRATSTGHAAELRDMMRAVVSQGTARNLQGRGVAGKTGTADVDGRSYNERWFAGYSTEGPYAIAVMTEGTGFGATAAGPIVASIARALR